MKPKLKLWLFGLIALTLSSLALYAQDSDENRDQKSPEVSQIDEQLAGVGDEQFKTRYLDWQSTIATAKARVNDNNTTSAQLDQSRSELVNARIQAQSYLDYNQSEIHDLQNRLNALGPPPEEGVSEAEEVAALRGQLNEEISRATLPSVLAGQVVDDISNAIGQIDREFRARYGQRLLTRNSSPLLPSAWQLTYLDLKQSYQAIRDELSTRVSDENYRFAIMRNWPTILGALLLGFALLFANRRLLEPVYEQILNWTKVVDRDFFQQLLSWLRDLLFPIGGSLLIIYALRLTSFFNAEGEFILASVSKIIIGLVITKWLANAYKTPHSASFVDRPGRRSIITQLGILSTVNWVLVGFVENEGLSIQTQSVFTLVLVVIGALILKRALGVFGIAEGDSSHHDDQFYWVLPTSKKIIHAIVYVVPILAILGYSALAHYIYFGVVNTIALIMGAYLFYELVNSFLAFVIPAVKKSIAEVEKENERLQPKAEDNEGRKLFPIILAGIIALSIFPFILHAWGMRYSDIEELWAVVNRGFLVGAARVSPFDLLRILLVLYIGFWLVRFGKRILSRTILPRTDYDIGTQTAIVSLFGYFGYLVATVWALRTSGLDLSSIAIVAGALSVGIGFGLQTIVSNFISGIILLVERPIKKGDWIKVNEYEGYVQQINVRATEIETFDMGSVIVPNADLISAPVLNWTHTSKMKRSVVSVGVAYGSDTEKVSDILVEIANAQPQVLRRPAANVVFKGFGNDSLDFDLRFYVREADMDVFVASNVRYSIEERFRAEGIEIPFSQRVVRFIHDDDGDGDTDTEVRIDE